MSYSFNPTPAESALLAQIAQRESSGNYTAINPSPGSTASGAYQFVNRTWQEAALATGVGDPYAPAWQNSPAAQDVNALWLLRNSGTAPWAASGPYYYTGGGGALVDLSGDAAAAPTSSILDQLQAASLLPAGLDLSTPGGMWLAVGLIAAMVWLIAK